MFYACAKVVSLLSIIVNTCLTIESKNLYNQLAAEPRYMIKTLILRTIVNIYVKIGQATLRKTSQNCKLLLRMQRPAVKESKVNWI